MQHLEQLPVLRVGDESISLAQSLKYLQLSGNLMPVIQDVVSQHVVYQELQERKDKYQLSSADIAQTMVDFRCRHKLTESDAFDAWLQSQGIDQALFQQRIAMNALLKQLKADIAQPDLQAMFDQQKDGLETVALEGLVLSDESLAKVLHERLQAGETMEALSEPTVGAPLVRRVRKDLRRGQLPEPLRAHVAQVPAGTLLKPLAMAEYWSIFQVESVTPAVLEGELKQQLEERLFQLWVAEKIKSLNVRLTQSNAEVVKETASIS